MKQSFTLNQCLRHIYKETSAEEGDMLEEIIRHNHRLKEEFSGMQKAYRSLCRVSWNPSREAVENILQYTKDNACLPAG